MPAKKLILPEIFFDSRTEAYWLKSSNTRYLNLSENNIKAHFQMAGFNAEMKNENGLTSMKEIIVRTQKERCIDYAGPLAGQKCGPRSIGGGKTILVTSEAMPVMPKRGTFPRVEKFLEQLFGEQLDFVLYWLKIAHASLLRGVFQPGQLMAMAGPPQCGKSFMHVLITMLLGGRAGKPYRYMTGQTHFNSDLAGAEHLVIEDENAKSNTAARREFGTQIKNWTVDEHISVHAKGREALMLGFYRRLSLSVNWEPEYLLILPPMDHSILDKVMLFKCSPAPLSADREKNIKMLRDELPALAWWLQRLNIPRRLQDDRFGVKAYHNPEILEILSDASAETRLLDLIDKVIFAEKKNNDEWRGSAIDLEQELSASDFRYAVDKLLPFSSACGTFLARLASKMPERFEQRKNKGRSIWLIKKGEQ